MLRAAYPKTVTPPAGTQKPEILFIQGFVVGIITGLFGIGGGFLIVPALYFWTRLPMKKSVGTALPIIAMNSLFSFCTSYSATLIDWSLLIRFSLGAIIGILIGTR